MAGNQKNVELVIKARDESKAVWRGATAEMLRYQAAASKTAQYRGLLKNQQDTAKAARDLSLDMKKVGLAASVDQVRGWRDARAAAKAATDQVRAFNAEQARSRGAVPATRGAGSFKAFDNSLTAGPAVNALGDALARVTAYEQRKSRFAMFDAVASGAARADVFVENLADAQTRLAAATDKASAAAARNTGAVRAQGAATDLAGRQAASWASRQGRGPLGLRPFELQNLGYQINDVFTQIASGTPVMQVAAQQGGQFIQIFPKLGGAMLRALPIIGLVTIALSPFITAMNKANSAGDTLKEFDLLLTRSGEGASYQAQGLANAADALDKYDGSLKDARAALTEFVGDSVAPEYLERFGKTALDLARVLKIEVTDAAKQVSDAFTGNADAVLALDDQLGFLTDAERKHMEALRDSKRDADVRTQAFAIFERRYGETAAKMRGPWTQILNDFTSAWSAFAETVNMIDFSEAGAKVQWLINKIAELTAMLPGARSANTDNAGAWLDRAMAARNRAALELDSRRSQFGANDGRTRAAQREYDYQVRETNRAQTAFTMAQFREGSNPLQQRTATPPPADTTLDPPKPANNSRDRKTDAERLAEQQRAFVAGLEAENEARRFQISLIDKEERERTVLDAIRQKELAAAELGLELTDRQRADIRQTTEALYDAERAHEALRLIEQARLELAEARGEVESRDDFVQRKIEEAGLVTRDLNTATGEVVITLSREGQEYQNILRSLWDINEATRQRQVAEKSVSDLLALRSSLTDREQFLRDSGRIPEADGMLWQIAAVDSQLVTAADSAIAMWRSIGGPEAEAAIAALQTTRETAAGLAQGAVASARQINELITDGGMNAFDQFTQSIADGVNAFTALRDAFLQFAADFLSKIAEMIMQQAILNLLRDSGMSKAGDGGPGGRIATALNGLFRHQGGTIGQGGGRPVPLAAFANATRYHTGGVIGLKPNERAVVAELGEEMLTASDPRHRNNLGKAGGGRDRSLKVVNVFDPAELLDAALGTEAGERVILNHVRRNSGAWKAAIG